MLHLALAALLAGSLGTGDAVNPSDTDKNPPTTTETTVGLVVASDSDLEAPVPTTYAFGRSQGTLLQVWGGYGWASVDQQYPVTHPGKDGHDLGYEVVSQRAFIGLQLNPIRSQNFTFGIGGELAMASREVTGAPTGDASSGFNIQQAKVYAELRGRTLGLHGGYIFDLADEDLDVHISKGSDAFFVGTSFDYPSRVVRVFAGIDYVQYADADALHRHPLSATTPQNSPSFVAFHAGLGFNISWVEIGAAAIMRSDIGVTSQGLHGGSHQGSIAPYLNISPPALPVSISVRGAFTDYYADYGLSLGGGGDIRTNKGFTAALSYGF